MHLPEGDPPRLHLQFVPLGPAPACLPDTAPPFRGAEEGLEVVGLIERSEPQYALWPVEGEAGEGEQERPGGHRPRIMAAALDLVPRVAGHRGAGDAVVAVPRAFDEGERLVR